MVTPKPTFGEQQIKYVELAAAKRGLILNQIINLEKAMDWRISKYFVPINEQPRIKLEEIVISNIPLVNKKHVLYELMQEYDKGFFIVHPNVFNQIDEIIRARNKMAHHWLDVTPFYRGKISEAKMNTFNVKGHGKPTSYDDKTISALSMKIEKCTNLILHWKIQRLPS